MNERIIAHINCDRNGTALKDKEYGMIVKIPLAAVIGPKSRRRKQVILL